MSLLSVAVVARLSAPTQLILNHAIWAPVQLDFAVVTALLRRANRRSKREWEGKGEKAKVTLPR